MASESMNKSKFTGRKISLVTSDACVTANTALASSVVNVNHRELVEQGVVNHQQLLLLKRVIERRILDCILASDYIKTCAAYKVSLTKNDLKLFLQISADIFRGSHKRQMRELLTEINTGLIPRFNLANIEILARLVFQALKAWLLSKNDSYHSSISQEYQGLLILKSQLEIKIDFWSQLNASDERKAYLEAHIQEANQGLEKCLSQLEKLTPVFEQLQNYQKQVVDALLSDLQNLISTDISAENFSTCLTEISSKLPELTGVLTMLNDLSLGRETDKASLWHWLTTIGPLSSGFLFEVNNEKQAPLSPVWRQAK
ncbi:T3SS regulon anti-activator ExsD domain-containing protein [Shewanella sp. SR44-3]|uniref:T3SS regulon anti-activator ExsD domain-containing protein n=1 Tax=unclassified Shewanella TaxID=196818 RepID=UPI0015FBED3F|nr:T3SS regulon anti-activator ExsD domain-containing protein [Shewanella sp. SR44-3]MBB1268998.1 T3SS regulon anti-activator ExsD family protein [Shewanella sp. SR44-3]